MGSIPGERRSGRREPADCPAAFPRGSRGVIELFVTGGDAPTGPDEMQLLLDCGSFVQAIDCRVESAEGLIVTPTRIDLGEIFPHRPTRFSFVAAARTGAALLIEGDRIAAQVTRIPPFGEHHEWLVECEITPEPLGDGGRD